MVLLANIGIFYLLFQGKSSKLSHFSQLKINKIKINEQNLLLNKFVMKQKFTNLHYGNRENLCRKNFLK